mgnify:CR=1 FL=1
MMLLSWIIKVECTEIGERLLGYEQPSLSLLLPPIVNFYKRLRLLVFSND